jgi:membrane protease YdiL (CAAX protease family)
MAQAGADGADRPRNRVVAAMKHVNDFAARLRGSGPVGVLAIVIVLGLSLAGPIVGALAVFAWARMSKTSFTSLGFTAPNRWAATLLGGIAAGIMLKVTMKAVVMPVLGAPPVNTPYQFLTGNAAALPGIILTVLVQAAVAEEVPYRGYLFERLGALVGRAHVALTFTVISSSVLFAAAHYADQGLPGVAQAAVTGVVFGAMFVRKRQLALVMIAHAAFDPTAVTFIFYGWEEPVARFLFR